MSTVKILDGGGDVRYLSATGDGTSGDPFVMVQGVDILSTVTQDVVVQDQISPAYMIPFHQEVVTTSLTAATVRGDLSIAVTSSASLAAGQLVSLYNVAGERFYKGAIVGTPTTTIVLDSPIDFEYQIGDQVTAAITNMAVNGSITPQVFRIRGPVPGTPAILDVTRIMISMSTVSATDLGAFGDLTALTNGCILRYTSTAYWLNYFNAKTNQDFSNAMYDYEAITDSKKFGTKGRLTFAGQEKLGVAIRVGADDNLEVVIQDDIRGLSSLYLTAQCHKVI